jgi:hypothetical protein
MHSPAVRSTYWLRRATALAAAVGLILISSLAPATAVTHSAAQQAGSACPAPPPAPKLGTTVTGPRMYDSKTHTQFQCPSTVTVSQTRDMTNQMVKVSWTGFTPSKGTLPYSPFTTYYPVQVAECRGDSPGTAPSTIEDSSSNPPCYWAGNGGTFVANGKYGPGNDVWGTTTAQGTGFVEIQIETFLQNQGLGCSATHDCSLLILPAEGGVPVPAAHPQCGDHSKDLGSYPDGYANGQATFSPPSVFVGDTCAWQDRIVVPLHFSSLGKSCGFSNPAFSVAGSPMMARAMTSWQSGVCSGAHPDPYSFNGSVEEPEARSIFQAGGDDDVALTTDPADGPGKHPYTYAPVGITATSVAYWVDDGKTGEPYTNLRLTPLLLTKMLTQSYQENGMACTKQELLHPPPPVHGQVCDPGVLNDSQDLFSDPEFKQLNPGLKLNEDNVNILGIPTVVQGNSDMTEEVTGWIAADQASASFLAGNVDQWGQHVNTSYLNAQFPTQQFVAQDPAGSAVFTYIPVSPLSRVVSYQAENWLPGINWPSSSCTTSNPPHCTQPADPAEQPGQRQLFAILDQADAAAFDMPAMKIENAAGDYVGPTATSMAAAVKNMIPNGSDGITKAYNDASKDPAAYPLTMVVYAMVPTGGISHGKAAKIAQWLDYVAGPGQHQGLVPGELPPGYLPLPASMRAQTRKAASEVLHQTGDHSAKRNGNGNGNGSNSGGGGTNGSGNSGSGHNGSAGTGNSPSAGTGTPQNVANASFSSPFSGTGRLVLVILLIAGGLLALAGPAAIVLGKPGGRAAVIAGWHRVLALRHGTRILQGRKKP